MISLQNDYSEGAHPQILKRLAEINLEQNPGCLRLSGSRYFLFSRRNPDQPGRYRYHAGAL